MPGRSTTTGFPHFHLRLAGRRRKPEPELETRRIVEHFDSRAMEAGDGSDQTEPEAVSRRITALFQPVEALENMLVLAGGNPGSIIGDRDDRAAVNGLVFNHDLATGAAVLDRIVHEIGDGIKDQITIAGHVHLTIADDGEAGGVLFGR